MNVLKAIKVAEIRKKLSIIPAKLIIAAVLTIIAFWDMKTKFEIETVWSNIQEDPKKYLLFFLIAYGAVSYVYFFIRLMHNWIFGVLLAAGVAFLVVTQTKKMGAVAFLVALIIMIFGGPVLDIFNFLRYFSLKSQVIRAEEERLDARYGEGYDDGFRRGIREGERNERQRSEISRGERYRIDEYDEYDDYDRRRIQGRGRFAEEDDYYEDERRIPGRNRNAYDDRSRLEYYEDEYDDEYEDAYDEEYEEDYEDSYEDGYEDGYYENEDYYEDKKRINTENSQQRIAQGNSEDAAGFFADCKTPSEIKRRYHDLCKVYHPDSGNGSAELFYRIKTEYDRLSANA